MLVRNPGGCVGQIDRGLRGQLGGAAVPRLLLAPPGVALLLAGTPLQLSRGGVRSLLLGSRGSLLLLSGLGCLEGLLCLRETLLQAEDLVSVIEKDPAGLCLSWRSWRPSGCRAGRSVLASPEPSRPAPASCFCRALTPCTGGAAELWSLEGLGVTAHAFATLDGECAISLALALA